MSSEPKHPKILIRMELLSEKLQKPMVTDSYRGSSQQERCRVQDKLSQLSISFVFTSSLFFVLFCFLALCLCMWFAHVQGEGLYVQGYKCTCVSSSTALQKVLSLLDQGLLLNPEPMDSTQPSQPCCLRNPVSITGVLGLQEACHTHLHLFLSVLIYSLRISRMYTMYYDPIHPCFYMLYPLSHPPSPVLSL